MVDRRWGLGGAVFILWMGCSSSPGREIIVATDAGLSDVAADNGTTTGGSCTQQSDCDDGIACTMDACVFGGTCVHTALDANCPTGQTCFASRGCAAATSCMSNTDCDDHIACTMDVCIAGNVCDFVRDDTSCGTGMVCSTTLGCVPTGHCGVDSDCDDGLYCTLPGHCVSGLCVSGGMRTCTASGTCTVTSCNEAMRMCISQTVSPCGGTVTSGTYTLSPTVTYSCGDGALTASSIVLTADLTGVTVTGFPVTLTGAAPSGGMFSVMGSGNMATCTWVYTLSGQFMSAGMFTGSWNVRFNNCDASLMCLSTSGFFTAVAH